MKKSNMRLLKTGISFIALVTISAHAGERNYSQQFLRCAKVASTTDAQATCVTAEIAVQKRRLNFAYANTIDKISPKDKIYLNKVQHEWITWRDDNYNFLAEHVPGSFVTTRMVSLDFLLRSIFDKATELETISDEVGGN